MRADAQVETRAGFVAILGATNAGKSTLLNRLVGVKLAIVTHKAQTTRSAIRGIAMCQNSQIIFVDTPGIFASKNRFDRAMLDTAWQNARECDLALLVHDAARKDIDPHTLTIAKQLHNTSIPMALVLNKIDLVPRPRLLTRAQTLTEQFDFRRVFMVSATKADGTDDICPWLAGALPASPYLYDSDDISDVPDRHLAAEIVREQLFLHLHDELPYQLTVETEDWQTRDDGSIAIHCAIIIANPRHRGMIIGKGGQHLARIGVAARTEMESVFGCRIHLINHVRVNRNWQSAWRAHHHA